MIKSCHDCPKLCESVKLILNQKTLLVSKAMILIDRLYSQCAKKYLQEENHDNISGHKGIIQNKNYTG